MAVIKKKLSIMYKIKNIRGTIFCPPVKYTKEIVSSLAEILNDYTPVLVRDSSLPPFVTIPTWQMIAPDESEVLFCNGDKIDLIKNYGVEIDDAEITKFANHCKDVFSKIMEQTGYACSRVAIAPTVIVTENGVRPDDLYHRLFGIQEFQHTIPAISNVSQVFRVNKTIGGKDIVINHVANFHAENEVANINGRNQLIETYQCDFDINTMVDPNYRFGIEEMKEFYGLSNSCFIDYYNLYFAD